MRYRIISEHPGRIRVRFVAHAFNKSLEVSIHKSALSNSYILSAEVHHANGSLLLVYKKKRRADVLRFINNLNFRTLRSLPEEDSNSISKIDKTFKKKLVKVGVNQLVRRLLIPAPLRPLYVACRATMYIFKGLSYIADGNLTVEVFDAASINACIDGHFPHSMVKAIVKGAEMRDVLHAEEHAEVNYIVAHGIATTIHGERAIIESHHFICEDEGMIIIAEQQAYINENAGTSSVIYLTVGGSLTEVLCINEPTSMIIPQKSH